MWKSIDENGWLAALLNTMAFFREREGVSIPLIMLHQETMVVSQIQPPDLQHITWKKN